MGGGGGRGEGGISSGRRGERLSKFGGRGRGREGSRVLYFPSL